MDLSEAELDRDSLNANWKSLSHVHRDALTETYQAMKLKAGEVVNNSSVIFLNTANLRYPFSI